MIFIPSFQAFLGVWVIVLKREGGPDVMEIFISHFRRYIGFAFLFPRVGWLMCEKYEALWGISGTESCLYVSLHWY